MRTITQSSELLLPSSDEEGLALVLLCELAARTCYDSVSRMTPDSHRTLIPSLIASGHESPLEMGDLVYKLVTSRDVMAEITRHRHASFSVQSQRYVTPEKGGDIAFIEPLRILHGEDFDPEWFYAMEDAEEHYFTLLDAGWKREDARKALPNSTATELVMKMNFREARHFFKLRTGKRAYPETRELALTMLSQAKERIPLIFDDIRKERTDTGE